MLRKLFRSKQECMVHKVATMPLKSVSIDDYINLPGIYTVFIDASEIGTVNDVSAKIFIKPHQDARPVKYVDAELLVGADGSPLWSAELPVCAGMSITLSQKTGYDCSMSIYVWRTDNA